MTVEVSQSVLVRTAKCCVLAASVLLLAACGGGGGGEGAPLPTEIEVRIADVVVTEGNSGSSIRAVTVNLSSASDEIVTVDYATANETAVAGSDYTATSGTLTFAPGQTSATVDVPIIGDTVDEDNETLRLNLSNPLGASLREDHAVITIQDNDGSTTPLLTIGDATVTEGNGGSAAVTLNVTMSAASAQNVTVVFAIGGGTAAVGADYTATSGTLTFTPGQTTRPIVVNVLGDTVDEANETVLVNLSNASGATIQDAQGVITITDDDGSAVPLMSIADASVTEGDSGTVTATLTVSLSTSSNDTVTAAYSTANGTATAGSDYTSASSSVTFNAGQTTRQISITVSGDTVDETNETVFVILASPSNATLGDAQATLTIVDDDDSFGLDARPSNPDCVAPARGTSGPTGVAVEDPFPTSPGFTEPTKILQAPGDANRWYVLEQSGRIRTFSTASPNTVTTWLDLTGRVNDANSGGLLGLAFHPSWPATREIFVSYTGTSSAQESRISRFVLDSATAPTLGGSSEQILLRADQSSGTHKGGDIDFGSDGSLYVSIGDSSENNDPNNRGQNTTRLAGKMLRIDVLGTGASYTIPGDNPFAGNALCGPASNAADCPEIYAWGFRNPWRWSFDSVSGQLWLGDVGERSREEIDVVALGGNYGWSCREGTQVFNSSRCGNPPFTDPVFEYEYGDGGNESVTGGYVYRGAAMPSLQGRYVFADFSSGRIWALESDGAGGYDAEQLADTNYGIVAFAEDANGELYFVDYSGGGIYRLVGTGGGGGDPDPVPDNLVDTGCVSTADPTQPASGLIPYSINAAFWSDNAVKSRYMGLPDGTTVSRGSGDWVLPNGTVLVKNFRLGGQLIETRLFMRHPDGGWAGYTYEWNDAQTAATRVRTGKTRSVGGQTWIYPSEAQCMSCHTSAAGFSLGLETRQLNRNSFYPSTGRTSDQLRTLDHIGVFDAPLPATITQIIADPNDTTESLEDRARAYLHTNCAGCHRPGGPTTSSMNLLVTTAFGSTATCDVVPATTDLGIANARLIAPGDAARSVVIARMARRDSDGMPPVGSTIVDASGAALLSSWVNGLSGCP